MACACTLTQLCLTLCDPMDCSLTGSSDHGDSSGKNTGVGYHALQGIFPTQRSNPGPPHCRWILYHLSQQGCPVGTGLYKWTWPALIFEESTFLLSLGFGADLYHFNWSVRTYIWNFYAREIGYFTLITLIKLLGLVFLSQSLFWRGIPTSKGRLPRMLTCLCRFTGAKQC